MPVTIGEVLTTIETAPGAHDAEGRASEAGAAPALEVHIEELRQVVRALVAEELERHLRQRGGCP